MVKMSNLSTLGSSFCIIIMHLRQPDCVTNLQLQGNNLKLIDNLSIAQLGDAGMMNAKLKLGFAGLERGFDLTQGEFK